MKAGRFFVTGTLIFTFALTACGAHKNARPGADAVVSQEQEGNALIAQVPKDSAELKSEYGIDLNSGKKIDWNKFDDGQKLSIRQRLQLIANKVARIDLLSHSKSARLTGNVSSLATIRSNALVHMNTLDFEDAAAKSKARVKVEADDLNSDSDSKN